MKIWITGNQGFLGGYLHEELLRLGHTVSGNDNLLCNSYVAPSGVVIDCCDYGGMYSALSAFRPDVLIHCAATAHEGLSNFSPSFITKNIYEASVTTFSAAISTGVKRIIFMSSMARYGRGDVSYDIDIGAGPPFHEMMMPRPIDPYGIAKVAAESTLRALGKVHDFEHVILVPHNIIGPRQKYDDPFRNVASIMINRALQEKPMFVYGDGKQKRCFSPIADCLPSIIRAIDSPDIVGEVVNIGPDKGEITISELAETIRDLTGGMAEIQYLPARPNEVKDAWCSSDKAREWLGFEPKQSLRDCLAEMVLYIKENGTKQFKYDFPVEIVKGCPKVWREQML